MLQAKDEAKTRSRFNLVAEASSNFAPSTVDLQSVPQRQTSSQPSPLAFWERDPSDEGDGTRGSAMRVEGGGGDSALDVALLQMGMQAKEAPARPQQASLVRQPSKLQQALAADLTGMATSVQQQMASVSWGRTQYDQQLLASESSPLQQPLARQQSKMQKALEADSVSTTELLSWDSSGEHALEAALRAAAEKNTQSAERKEEDSDADRHTVPALEGETPLVTAASFMVSAFSGAASLAVFNEEDEEEEEEAVAEEDVLQKGVAEDDEVEEKSVVNLASVIPAAGTQDASRTEESVAAAEEDASAAGDAAVVGLSGAIVGAAATWLCVCVRTLKKDNIIL